MTAKLSDAITTTLNFDKTAVPKTGATAEQIEEHKWFKDTFVHLISLFHGVALATLRGDYNMENIVVRVHELEACGMTCAVSYLPCLWRTRSLRAAEGQGLRCVMCIRCNTWLAACPAALLPHLSLPQSAWSTPRFAESPPPDQGSRYHAMYRA